MAMLDLSAKNAQTPSTIETENSAVQKNADLMLIKIAEILLNQDLPVEIIADLTALPVHKIVSLNKTSE